jgi:hypothetical protein
MPPLQRPRAATTTELPSTPTISTMSTMLSSQAESDYSLPPLAPLDLSVLTEEPSLSNGAGNLLADELERILVGFSGVLDIIGNGLSALEIQTRPIEKINVADFEFARDEKERSDSLTNSFKPGGTLVRRN